MTAEREAVLILSTPSDTHYQAVDYALRRAGVDVELLSCGRFPRFDAHVLEMDDTNDDYVVESDGVRFRPASFKAVWNRRDVVPRVSQDLAPGDQAAAALEAQMLIDGMKLIGGLGQRWINHPTVERIAGCKPLQLRIARGSGMRIPATIMTNDPNAARDFVASQPGGCVLKTFYPMSWHSEGTTHMAYARRVTDEDLEDDEAISATAHLFQQYVDKAFELRVYYLGGSLVTVRLDSQLAARTAVDWRTAFDGSLPISETSVPMALRTSIERYSRHFGLEYGAFDFVVSESGDHYFLECNPSGQFLFVEEWEPSIRMTAAFGRALTRDLGLSADQRRTIDDFSLSDLLGDRAAMRFYADRAAEAPKLGGQGFHYRD